MFRKSELPRLSRREWLKLSAAGVTAFSASGWMEAFAAENAKNPQRRRSCILLWMNGGPTQMETFDCKPGHENGGPIKEIETSAKGVKISEFLPKLSKFADHMALIRSMSTKEADHGRGSFLMRTGQAPTGPIQYPTIGSLVSKEVGDEKAPLPNFVSIAPYRFFNQGAYGPGFLGPQYAPLIVGETNINFQQPGQVNYDQILKVQDLAQPGDVSDKQLDARIELLRDMEKDFVDRHPGVAPLSHQTAYERAVKLMKTDAAKAFNLEEEKDEVRDAYGKNLFGQGCLLARRLVERGVPFIEVTLGGFNNNALGWDTHANNFDSVRQLCGILDPAWATLMEDLKTRGLLETTTILWMGEFGRTPKINQARGRDHWANSWSTVLAGGGIKGGTIYGKTSDDGMEVKENPVSVLDLLATLCKAMGVDYTKQNMSNVGRPIRIVDKGGKAIEEILA